MLKDNEVLPTAVTESRTQKEEDDGRLCNEEPDPYHYQADTESEFIHHYLVNNESRSNKLNQDFVQVFDFPRVYTDHSTWDPNGQIPRLQQPVNCVRKKYHRSEFAIYSEVTGISRHWVMNSKGTGYHFNFVMSQNGTSLQVWFNNPDEKKTESLYNKLRKLVNKERYLMVNKPFPCALENTHKYGIGISSGTALRMFDIIRKPV